MKKFLWLRSWQVNKTRHKNPVIKYLWTCHRSVSTKIIIMMWHKVDLKFKFSYFTNYRHKIFNNYQSVYFVSVSYYKEPPPLLIASNETTEWKNHFNQLSSGNGIFSHIRIDDPYFEEMAKANKCKDESELLEVCFKSSSQLGVFANWFMKFRKILK